MKISINLVLYFSVLLCAGCGTSVINNSRLPKVNYPVSWKQSVNWTHNSNLENMRQCSWNDFNDAKLEKLLNQVISLNNNLETLVLRVYRAKLDEEQIGISSSPKIQGSLNTSISNALYNSLPSNYSSMSSFSTSYETDMWGKIKDQQMAAKLSRQATEQDFLSARLLLLSAASNNYWKISFINQQIDVSKKSISYAKYSLRLANVKFHAGKISALDILNAEQNLINQENFLLELERGRKQARNEQTLLLGTPPESTVIESSKLATALLPKISPGILVNALNLRPDIQAKELRLREALINVDIKREQLYPTFTLTGSMGTSSIALLEFLRNPIGAVSANLSLPFLELHQMKLDIKIARNDYEQRVLEFKQALYQAMADVDNALTLRAQLLAQEAHLHTVVELARKSERLNELRYREGAVSISFWLDAQEQRRQAELSMSFNLYNQYQNMAQIYTELGISNLRCS